MTDYGHDLLFGTFVTPNAGAADLAALADRYDRGTETTVMDWEYLLLTARKRG